MLLPFLKGSFHSNSSLAAITFPFFKVYVCVNSISSVLILIIGNFRIVGMGGIGDSLLLVSFCGLCTFLTAISLSAIATNGAMKVCVCLDNSESS